MTMPAAGAAAYDISGLRQDTQNDDGMRKNTAFLMPETSGIQYLAPTPDMWHPVADLKYSTITEYRSSIQDNTTYTPEQKDGYDNMIKNIVIEAHTLKPQAFGIWTGIVLVLILVFMLILNIPYAWVPAVALIIPIGIIVYARTTGERRGTNFYDEYIKDVNMRLRGSNLRRVSESYNAEEAEKERNRIAEMQAQAMAGANRRNGGPGALDLMAMNAVSKMF